MSVRCGFCHTRRMLKYWSECGRGPVIVTSGWYTRRGWEKWFCLKRRVLNEDFINIFTILMEGYKEDGHSQTLFGCTWQKDKRIARCNKGLDREENVLSVRMGEHWNEVTWPPSLEILKTPQGRAWTIWSLDFPFNLNYSVIYLIAFLILYIGFYRTRIYFQLIRNVNRIKEYALP